MKNRIRNRWRVIAGFVCVLAVAVWIKGEEKEGGEAPYGAVWDALARLWTEEVTEVYVPLLAYADGDGVLSVSAGVLNENVMWEFPIYEYCAKEGQLSCGQQEDMEDDDIWEWELTEEPLAEQSKAEQGELRQTQEYQPEAEQTGGMTGQEKEGNVWGETGQGAGEEPDLVQAMEQENVSAMAGGNAVSDIFIPHQQCNTFDWAALAEYQTLISTFYTVDAGTMIGSSQLNAETLQARDLTIDKTAPAPQILIYHTHSLEAFADSKPGERSQTIVGVGDRLAEILTEQYGYGVLHHTGEYDTVRDEAYAKSLPALQQILEENPSIQVVIDLHRDSGAENVKRAIDLDGRPTATFMLFNGLSRTRKTGDIAYLKNPNLEDNLAFSFQMQVKAGEYYPGLTRKIYLKAYRYNMHLMPRTLLIELGDSNSTVEEAMNTCDPLAHVLDMVLSGDGENADSLEERNETGKLSGVP